nr:MAG TPA: hypothetical protein [Caudoviricetes sp.]
MCLVVLHICCMHGTTHRFPELLITLSKKGLSL